MLLVGLSSRSSFRSRGRGSLGGGSRGSLLLDRGRGRGRSFLLLAGNEGRETEECYDKSETELFHFKASCFVLLIFLFYLISTEIRRFIKPS